MTSWTSTPLMPVGRYTGGRVGAALGGIEGDGDPGLRGCGRGLQILQSTQLVNQLCAVGRFGAAGVWPERGNGIDQFPHPGT
ncbi:hypothetical protein ACSVHC_06650 [Arthrobacter sp. KNU-44]|uniref:hypothetical protein n=1 Tax=unclassified Arthrobacter TaxID=235627 RepID=UPI003F42ED16